MQNILLYSLIFLSGCAGLIYEVVWHRYLAILLGAQARATAIVLAIFLGGIAAGYATFGRWSRYKKWNLLKAYAYVELGLCLWAAFFPLLFRAMVPFTPHLYAWFGVSNLFIDVFVSILLIGLPTFLMGGTLPLLTQGMSEDLARASKTHAKIYGINTVGACFGSLLAGYVLIPTGGLPFSSWLGSLLNAVVGISVLLYFAKKWKTSPGEKATKDNRKFRDRFTTTEVALLGVGFLSGFYLLSLQTIFIRLVGLSTGSSNYNFTLIVSIFIFSLGLGSLLVRRIGDLKVKHLMWNQIGVAVFLLALYVSGDRWSYWVHLIRASLRDNVENFYLYQAMLGICFTSLMVVPVGLAGLTLPLTFHLLKDRTETLGQRVGQLYGLNSVGCVLGALVGGYLLLEFFNLDQLFKFNIFLVLLTVGFTAYLDWKSLKARRWETSLGGALVAGVFTALLIIPLYHRDRFTQPFRQSQPIPNVTYEGVEAFGKYLGRSTEYVYFKDGPNTSLGVGSSSYQGKEMSRTIFVNGKSDGNTRGDYFTTVMLGHLPGLFAKKMENVCVVGFGTGTTVGTLGLYDDLKRLDVVEISGTIIKNASLFDAYNGNVSKNEKVHFNEMDAFRFLVGTTKKFDVIVSEPSNPWVAGIENLYSAEFYGMARKKLENDGLFVQWIHTYSFTDQLFRMVLKTMSGQFPNISIFQLRGGDFALVAKNAPFTKEDIARAEMRMKTSPIVFKALVEAGMGRIEGVLALEMVPNSLVTVMGDGMMEHRLESPRLSNDAAKAFFTNAAVNINTFRRSFNAYYASIPNSLLALYTDGNMPSADAARSMRQSFCDNLASKNNTLCEESLVLSRLVDSHFRVDPTAEITLPTRDITSLETFSFFPLGKSNRGVASLTDLGNVPKMPFSSDKGLQEVYDMLELFKKYQSPITQLPVSHLLSKLHGCLSSTSYYKELYGECLLQKILVLETVRSGDPHYKETVKSYLEWFDRLDKKTKNYEKLRDARDILIKMASVK